ncbi:MAG: VIT1/CCC1 transporter family protein [Candidatus Brocadiales bacterium]
MTLPTALKSEPRENWHSPEGKLIREVILGINDGMIETLGFVTGVFGATAAGKIIVIAGMAQIIAGSISMGIGAYVSQKSFKEFCDKEEDIEKKEIETKPEEERAEIEAIYSKKGFRGDELKMVVGRITSDKKVWLETMMAQELGLIREGYTHPVKSGAITGLAYILGAIPPLAPYFLFSVDTAFVTSVLLSMTFLFLVGTMKSRWARIWWVWSGVEMTAFGLGAVIITYSIGRLISTFFATDII